MASNKNVVLLAKALGYNNKLMYWEPILRVFVNKFPETKVFTSITESNISGTLVKVEKVAHFSTFGHSFPSPGLLIKLRKLKPDLIIVVEFNILSIYSVFLRLFSPSLRLLLLVENDPAYLYGYGIQRKGYIVNMVRRWIAAGVDHVLTNNNFGRKYLEESLRVPANKIDAKPFLTSSLLKGSYVYTPPNTGEPLKLLVVGQLIERKGIHYLIDAIALLPEDKRNQLHLHIVGDGDYRHVLEEKALLLGLPNVITFHGQHPYEEMHKFFCNAHVFVFPTLADYRALVGFEAISLGLPIIGSVFDGASSEAVHEGVNGFIVDPRDTKLLSKKIFLLINNSVLLKQFSAASTEIARSKTVDGVTDNLVFTCQKLLKEKL